MGTIKKFFADRRGAFAMQFALLVVPLTVCTGLAIDGGRAFLARYELSSALDAAALAVGSTIDEDTDPNVIAHAFVNANFHGDHAGPIALELDPGDDEDDTVMLKGTVTINTYFMPLVGQPTVTVSAESQVRRGGANVEVALALDVTSSMTMGVDRMTPLKAAAKDLINTVVTDIQEPFYSRVAIVPWGSAVHVGNLADDLRGEVAGPVSITAATWRDGTAKTISNSPSTGWRKNPGGAALSTSSSWLTTWRNGTAKGISGITNAAQAVVTSNGHGLPNDAIVYIYGVNGMTQINGKKYVVSDTATNTFKIKDPATNFYINTSRGYSTYTGSNPNDFAQRCFNSGCEVRITTANNNSFAAGDFIYMAGVGSPYGGVNSTPGGNAWTVSSLTAPTATTFFLAGSNGPAISGTDIDAASGGTASECFVLTCKFTVTATNHGFSDGQFVFIAGASVATGGSSSGTSINSSSSPASPWTVENATTNTFTLPGNGPSYRDHAGGTAQKCFTSTCEVRVTAAGHGLANNDYTQISGTNGMDDVLDQSGNNSRSVKNVDTDTFIVSGVSGPGHSDYTSGGQSQCLTSGCAKYRYTKSGGGTVIKSISNCVSERIGAQAYTDAGPDGAPLGRYYPAGGYNVCGTANWIAPLTDNKVALRHHIDSLTVTGSTAGQVGVAWGWYMLSPNWGDIWDSFETDEDDGQGTTNYYAPALYDAPNTSKVLILMTDGEFNTAHYNGVASKNYAVTSSSDVINNDATNGNPFTQAQTICDAVDPDVEDPEDAEKMLVFTIGFQIDPDGDAAEFLEQCASQPSYFFLSEDGTELQKDFRDIAKEITKLRIAR
jgi:Flp pilus assembly protein TadG